MCPNQSPTWFSHDAYVGVGKQLLADRCQGAPGRRGLRVALRGTGQGDGREAARTIEQDTGLRAQDGCTDRSYRVARDCSVSVDVDCPRFNAAGARIGNMTTGGTVRVTDGGSLVGILQTTASWLVGPPCFSSFDVTGEPAN